MKTHLLLASAASLFALSAVPAAAQLAAPSLSVPGTTIPTADVPSVEVPSVTTPSVTTPSVSTPPASTPPLSTPPVATPPASVTLDASATIGHSLGTEAQLSTLSAAMTAADLTVTWDGAGPFTLFAPTNAAFDLLSASTREQLMLPANKAALAMILNYHVVPGRITAAELQQRIEAGGGSAQLETVGGQALTARVENGVIVLTGANNSRAYVTQGDVAQANGMVHIVNGVLIPPA